MEIRLLLPLILATLTACSSEPIRSSDPLTQSSAVAVSKPAFVTNSDTTMSWRRDLVWVDDPDGRFERRARSLQVALQQELEHKGYQFLPQGAGADYEVLAVALLGDPGDHAELQAQVRLYPALASAAGDYEHGTVLVASAPGGSNDIVWRGALQVFSDPGMTPVAERERRMRWGAANLLAGIPAHN